MTAISWKSTISGNWNTATNWSTGTVPGANDDVTIAPSAALTVTYSSGTSSVLSLYTNSYTTLAVTGGALKVAGNSLLYGGATQSGGTLTFAGASATIYGNVQQTAGTMSAASGVLTLYGTNTFAGTLSGTFVDFTSGADTLQSTAVLAAKRVDVDGATLTLSASLSYTGIWDLTSGILALGGTSLTLSGPSTLDGGAITGSGKLTLLGSTELYNVAVEGSTRLLNYGTVDQIGSWYLGYNSTDTPQLTNAAGHTFRIDASSYSYMYATAGASFTNAGTLLKAGSGTAYIQATTTSTGTITVSSGNLDFYGVNNSIAGTVGGSGTLEFSGGSAKLSGATLSVGSILLDGATLTLGAAENYAGAWTQTYGTLALGGNTLTLTGTSNFDGGVANGAGSLVVKGTSEIDDYALEGTILFQNFGALTQSGYVYIGYNSGDTVTLRNEAGAVYTLAPGAYITGTTGSQFRNAGGKLVKLGVGDTSTIYVALNSYSSVNIVGGTLALRGANNIIQGSVYGGGTIEFSAGATVVNSGASFQTKQVLLDGTTMSLATSITYVGQWSQTAGTLALGGQTLTLSGSLVQTGGIINGGGTVSLSGTSAFGGVFELEGSAAIVNTGTITQTQYWYVGYNSGDTAKFTNAAGGTLNIVANAGIYGTSGSSVSNAGTIVKSGSGTSYIVDTFTNTGTVKVASGLLNLEGVSNSLGGTFSGAGALDLSQGSDTLVSGVTISTGALLLAGATVTLGTSVTYAGAFNQTSGILALGGKTLTLSGSATFDGGSATGSGKIAVTGGGELNGYYLQGSTVLANSGLLGQDDFLYVGYNTGDTALLSNLAGATYNLQSGSNIYGTTGSSLNNAGGIVKTGFSTTSVNIATINTGTVEVQNGKLSFLGAVSGAGTFTVDASTSLSFSSAVGSGGTVKLGAGSTLGLTATSTFGDTISGFAAGNVIDLLGFGYSGTTLAFNSGTDQLTATSGSSHITLKLAGSYTSSSFHLFSDNGTAAISHT